MDNSITENNNNNENNNDNSDNTSKHQVSAAVNSMPTHVSHHHLTQQLS